MIPETFYLPISSNTLPHYFGRGVLLPAKYYLNKAADLQNVMNNSMLLCSNRWVRNSDCCLEIVFAEKEKSLLIQISEHFFAFNGALPISRLKKVFLRNSEQARTTAWNINNGAAFLPEHLIEIDSSEKSELIFEEELQNQKEYSENTVDFSKKAKYFDHLLGGVSLLRIAGEPYMNYSQNYFATIGFFNSRINGDFSKAVSEKKIKYINNLSGLFTKGDNEWSKWQSYFYQNVSIEDVEDVANSEKVKIQKRLGIPQLENINPDSIIYDLLVLAMYGETKNKGLDNFVSDLINGNFPVKKNEELALIVGLNNGYSTLRNKYKLLNSIKTVKFELNSRLDYYIVESVFQFAFNGVKNNSYFSYIDQFVPENNESKPAKEAYRIIDKWILPKKKSQVFSTEYLEEYLQNNSPNEIYQVLTKYVIQWLPPFVPKNIYEGEKFFANILQSPISNWGKTLINQLKTDHEDYIAEEKHEIIQQMNAERNVLQQKIDSLTSEVFYLKSQLTASQNSALIIKQIPDLKQKNVDVEDHQKMVSEIQSEPNYNILSVPKLKEIAKEKGIKPLPKSKEELINAIKSIKKFL